MITNVSSTYERTEGQDKYPFRFTDKSFGAINFFGGSNANLYLIESMHQPTTVELN